MPRCARCGRLTLLAGVCDVCLRTWEFLAPVALATIVLIGALILFSPWP